MTKFEKFALDHERHWHCAACGGCLLDPRIGTMAIAPIWWCVGCMKRIDSKMPPGAPRPWAGGVILA